MNNRNTHSENCRYNDNDKLMYARMQLNEKVFCLISAKELTVFDEYFAAATEKQDKTLIIDYDQSDNEPYQIVYGGMLYNDWCSYESAVETAEDIKGYALFDIEDEKKVNVSGYTDIVFFPEKAVSKFYIPFAALVQTTHRFENLQASITFFPAFANHFVWESMINRPFLLAARKGVLVEELDISNWKEYLDEEVLVDAYNQADLVL